MEKKKKKIQLGKKILLVILTIMLVSMNVNIPSVEAINAYEVNISAREGSTYDLDFANEYWDENNTSIDRQIKIKVPYTGKYNITFYMDSSIDEDTYRAAAKTLEEYKMNCEIYEENTSNKQKCEFMPINNSLDGADQTINNVYLEKNKNYIISLKWNVYNELNNEQKEEIELSWVDLAFKLQENNDEDSFTKIDVLSDELNNLVTQEELIKEIHQYSDNSTTSGPNNSVGASLRYKLKKNRYYTIGGSDTENGIDVYIKNGEEIYKIRSEYLSDKKITVEELIRTGIRFDDIENCEMIITVKNIRYARILEGTIYDYLDSDGNKINSSNKKIKVSVSSGDDFSGAGISSESFNLNGQINVSKNGIYRFANGFDSTNNLTKNVVEEESALKYIEIKEEDYKNKNTKIWIKSKDAALNIFLGEQAVATVEAGGQIALYTKGLVETDNNQQTLANELRNATGTKKLYILPKSGILKPNNWPDRLTVVTTNKNGREYTYTKNGEKFICGVYSTKYTFDINKKEVENREATEDEINDANKNKEQVENTQRTEEEDNTLDATWTYGSSEENSIKRDEEPGFFESILNTLIQGVGWLLQSLVDWSFPEEGDNNSVTLDKIVFNKLESLKITYFNDKGVSSGTTNWSNIIKGTVSNLYKTFVGFATVIYLFILIYTGIKIVLSTTGSEKSKYKDMLKNWLIGLVILYLFQYVMYAVIEINDSLVDYVKEISVGGANNQREIEEMQENFRRLGIKTYYTYVGEDGNGTETGTACNLSASAMWLILIIKTIVFAIFYFKRFLNITVLIVVFPFITITYAIDKMGDGKSQVLDAWISEFLVNVFIQSVHAIAYVSIVGVALALSGKSGILAVVAMLSFDKIADQIIMFFGLKPKAGMFKGLAGSALQFSAMKNMVTGTAGKIGKNLAGVAGGVSDYRRIGREQRTEEDIRKKGLSNIKLDKSAGTSKPALSAAKNTAKVVGAGVAGAATVAIAGNGGPGTDGKQEGYANGQNDQANAQKQAEEQQAALEEPTKSVKDTNSKTVTLTDDEIAAMQNQLFTPKEMMERDAKRAEQKREAAKRIVGSGAGLIGSVAVAPGAFVAGLGANGLNGAVTATTTAMDAANWIGDKTLGNAAKYTSKAMSYAEAVNKNNVDDKEIEKALGIDGVDLAEEDRNKYIGAYKKARKKAASTGRSDKALEVYAAEAPSHYNLHKSNGERYGVQQKTYLSSGSKSYKVELEPTANQAVDKMLELQQNNIPEKDTVVVPGKEHEVKVKRGAPKVKVAQIDSKEVNTKQAIQALKLDTPVGRASLKKQLQDELGRDASVENIKLNTKGDKVNVDIDCQAPELGRINVKVDRNKYDAGLVTQVTKAYKKEARNMQKEVAIDQVNSKFKSEGVQIKKARTNRNKRN